MSKLYYIISDTHFGVKNNSIRFLESQLEGLKNMLNDVRRDRELHIYDEINLMHCGDMWDSRSFINIYILSRVKEMIEEWSKVFDSVYILGGNHDYYSTIKRDYNVTFLDELGVPENVFIISQMEYWIDDNTVLIPWFSFHNRESLKNILELEPKIIFTHTDLGHLTDDIKDLVDRFNGTIYSGHIHIPNLDNSKRVTLGSCFAMNFADSNSDRYYYKWDEDMIESVPMKGIRRFWRLYENTLENNYEINRDDYIEIYIKMDVFDSNKSIIDYYRSNFINANVIIIPNEEENIEEISNINNIDIDTIIDEYIPESLIENLNILRKQMRDGY